MLKFVLDRIAFDSYQDKSKKSITEFSRKKNGQVYLLIVHDRMYHRVYEITVEYD